MSLHKEIEFENDICAHLGASGWLYAEGDAAHYDRARALFPADVLAWVQTTQPQAWEALAKNHGGAAEATLLDRIRKQLDDRGTLDVLRHGVELLGLRQPLALAQFKPALAMNPDLQARYQANRLRVVRQVRYSLHNENAIDLVLFVNGLPVATVELKSDFTQSVEDAVDQYRFDRNPRPKGQSAAEPLLDFPRGALVHFAVSNSEVRMTTKLQGAATFFLPFNKGDGGGAGNPVNPHGHRTAYLWEEVWARDSWLEILGRYLVAIPVGSTVICGTVSAAPPTPRRNCGLNWHRCSSALSWASRQTWSSTQATSSPGSKRCGTTNVKSSAPPPMRNGLPIGASVTTRITASLSARQTQPRR